jgi:hypothetical protein
VKFADGPDRVNPARQKPKKVLHIVRKNCLRPHNFKKEIAEIEIENSGVNRGKDVGAGTYLQNRRRRWKKNSSASRCQRKNITHEKETEPKSLFARISRSDKGAKDTWHAPPRPLLGLI